MKEKLAMESWEDALFQRLSRAQLVLLITLISIVFSFILLVVFSWIGGTNVNIRSAMITIFISATVASLISSYFIKLVHRIEKLEDALRRMATHDSVTGLASRPAFMWEAEKLHSKGLRRRTNVAVIYIDLDNFKTVNDVYGHAAGDKALSYAGEAIKNSFPNGTLIGRIGGDELSVMLYDTTQEKIVGMLKSFRSKLSGYSNTFSATRKTDITASIGISIAYPHKSGLSFDALLVQADKALYYAKHHGRDCIVMYGRRGKPELLVS